MGARITTLFRFSRLCSERGNTVSEYALLCSLGMLVCITVTSATGAHSYTTFKLIGIAMNEGGGSHGSGTGDDNMGETSILARQERQAQDSISENLDASGSAKN